MKRVRQALAAMMLSFSLVGLAAGPAHANYWCNQTVETEQDTGYTSGDGQYMEVHHVIEEHRVEYDELGNVVDDEYLDTIHDEYHWRLIADPNDSGYCTDYPDATLC